MTSGFTHKNYVLSYYDGNTLVSMYNDTRDVWKYILESFEHDVEWFVHREEFNILNFAIEVSRDIKRHRFLPNLNASSVKITCPSNSAWDLCYENRALVMATMKKNKVITKKNRVVTV